MADRTYPELMRMRKKELAYKLMACQVTINKSIEDLERALNVQTPVPVLDTVALTQDIEHVLKYSIGDDKAEDIAIMLCKKGLGYEHNNPYEDNSQRA